MFFKALFGSGRPASSGNFWQGFACVVRPSRNENGRRQSVFPVARASFEETSLYHYSLVLESLGQAGKVQRFPLSENMRVTLTTQRDSAIFELQEASFSLLLEFPSAEEIYDSAGIFREILGRLLFQTAHKKNAEDCRTIAAEISKRVAVINATDILPPSAQMRKVIEDYVKSGMIFLAPGHWGSIDAQKVSSKAQTIASDCAIGVRGRGGFLYELFIISNTGKEIYCKKLTEEFYYYADSSRCALTWLDLQREAFCYQFVLFEISPEDLRQKIATCIVESQNKQSLEEVVARHKNDWDKFYLTPAPRAAEDLRLCPSVLQNADKLEYTSLVKAAAGSGKARTPIKLFQQAKTRGLCFTSRGNEIEVFQLQPGSDGGIELKTHLPPFTSDENVILPRQMLLVDEDRHLALLDELDLNKLCYNDVEKGKVTREWKTNTQLRELSLADGKNGCEKLLAVARKEIMLMDPRTKNLIVDIASYSTDYSFEKIIGTKGNNLVVGSANGDLRFYNQVSGRAKNLIPAPIAGSIRCLDCSRDGNFLLVTYAQSVLLLPTFQNSRSAFDCTFPRGAKPPASVLQISPQAMARYKISKLDFISAKFDEKTAFQESHIVAATGEFLVLWDFAEALQGRVVSSHVKRMNGPVIGSEFCYDRDELLGASPMSLFVQSTRKVPIIESFNR